MVEVHRFGKGVIYLAPEAIASIEPAGPNGFGISAYLRTVDGRSIDCGESAERLVAKVGAALAARGVGGEG